MKPNTGPTKPGALELETTRRPLTRREKAQIVVFGFGVCMAPIGGGMAFAPQEPCTASYAAAHPQEDCSTTPTRIQGAVIGILGLAGAWWGREPLEARRKSSAWDQAKR